MATVSGPSRCGSARRAPSWAQAHGTDVSGVGCLSSCSSHTQLSDTVAPRRPPQQREHRCDLRLQAGAVQAWDSPGQELRGRLALRGSCERRPSPPRSPLRVRRRPESSRQPIPPPEPPSQAARAGKNAERARSSCKVSALSGARGIKEGAGLSGSNSGRGRGRVGATRGRGRGRDDAVSGYFLSGKLSSALQGSTFPFQKAGCRRCPSPWQAG